MRVLLDCRMASWTGIGRYTVGLARALGARDDIELVQVGAAGERPPVAPHQGARCIFASKHPFSIAGARELSRIATTVNADVLHCTHFPTPMPPSHPLVVTIHDLMPLLVPGIMPSLPKRLAYRYWNRRAAKIADRVIVPSLSTAADVTALFPTAADKTRVTPEASDEFAAGPMGLLDPALAEVADWPYLLSMGSTRKHKDLPTLLDAFARIAVARPELRLLLVGADDYPYLDGQMLGVPAAIRERVVFTGHVEDPQLRTLFAGAQTFVFPSRYEGFGLPPLEAMSFGAPCIVADATSLPEVVGDAALLFPPGDSAALAGAIESVLTDPELRDDLAHAGVERARLFSWAHTAEETVAVYREVLGGQAAPPSAEVDEEL
ncbi:MAG: glycosyltransferase family 1 protein [Coriobacteriia bacterium]|nr:glycosyltransferase family 1 protein [Coriobacteriia bacterium]